jgi:hypothetical protein
LEGVIARRERQERERERLGERDEWDKEQQVRCLLTLLALLVQKYKYRRRFTGTKVQILT